MGSAGVVHECVWLPGVQASLPVQVRGRSGCASIHVLPATKHRHSSPHPQLALVSELQSPREQENVAEPVYGLFELIVESVTVASSLWSV